MIYSAWGKVKHDFGICYPNLSDKGPETSILTRGFSSFSFGRFGIYTKGFGKVTGSVEEGKEGIQLVLP